MCFLEFGPHNFLPLSFETNGALVILIEWFFLDDIAGSLEMMGDALDLLEEPDTVAPVAFGLKIV
jgi:hypothetical protein